MDLWVFLGKSEGDSVSIVGNSVAVSVLNIEDSVVKVGGAVGLGLEILW